MENLIIFGCLFVFGAFAFLKALYSSVMGSCSLGVEMSREKVKYIEKITENLFEPNASDIARFVYLKTHAEGKTRELFPAFAKWFDISREFLRFCKWRVHLFETYSREIRWWQVRQLFWLHNRKNVYALIPDKSFQPLDLLSDTPLTEADLATPIDPPQEVIDFLHAVQCTRDISEETFNPVVQTCLLEACSMMGVPAAFLSDHPFGATRESAQRYLEHMDHLRQHDPVGFMSEYESFKQASEQSADAMVVIGRLFEEVQTCTQEMTLVNVDVSLDPEDDPRHTLALVQGQFYACIQALTSMQSYRRLSTNEMAHVSVTIARLKSQMKDVQGLKERVHALRDQVADKLEAIVATDLSLWPDVIDRLEALHPMHDSLNHIRALLRLAQLSTRRVGTLLLDSDDQEDEGYPMRTLHQLRHAEELLGTAQDCLHQCVTIAHPLYPPDSPSPFMPTV